MTPYCPNSRHRFAVKKSKEKHETLRYGFYLRHPLIDRNGIILDESRITVEMLEKDLAHTDWIKNKEEAP